MRLHCAYAHSTAYSVAVMFREDQERKLKEKQAKAQKQERKA